MASRPEVTVIVGAYSRERFLPFALRSMLAQTLPRDRFEVVVVKNFRSTEHDRALAEAGAAVLYSEERRIGRWLRPAIQASRAPILAFCDDDDEFEPDRLEQLLEVFRSHPDLGFYRNRVRVIDIDGRPIPEDLWREHERDSELDTLGPVYRPRGASADLLDIATRRTQATFGSSTMAIRRELLDGEFGDAFVRTQLPDLFFFLAGALSSCGVYLDDRRLTRYRYYGGNVTREVGWLREAAESERDMAHLAESHGRPDFARWLSARAINHERLFLSGSLVARVGSEAARREVAHRTAEYLRFLDGHPEERSWTLDSWAAPIYGLSFLVAPSIIGRVARARIAARTVH
ncbi:MAG TPA: glycosyltransferase [Thermoplasmata archaeon]|jgi:glycosyltransferase involved in cell wall biosynthesis|nr:glycosyltransferase [Thermoplasmata archaeon]HYB78247.1 glycosyltransferase [Thermoplasmata archaeon]